MRSGERLPSTRELASELSVARKTITNFYDLLISEGFLEGRRGSGTFVSGGISEKKRTPRGRKSPIVVNKYWNQLPRLLAVQPKGLRFDFGLGVPDTSRFAFSLWRSILSSRARMLTKNADTYAHPQGYAPLREAIARYTGFTRAVICSRDDVVITNGAQQAFALIADVLLSPGSVVAMEHPGYERARSLFESRGARIVEVPVDEEGLVVNRLPREARVCYVTPSHQFPLGVRMSLRRRLALLEWAATHEAAVIEDDYDSEFRLSARPLDSLQSLDPHRVVLYVGTFSKVLFPGVRVGFVVAPQPIRDAVVAARQLTDWHGPLLIQATLAKFIHEGHLARHIRKMRRVYKERRHVLLNCLQSELSEWLKVWPSFAGLHIAVASRRAFSPEEVTQSAERLGVCVQSLGEHGLALGYGAIQVDQIEKGIRLLKQAITATRSRETASNLKSKSTS